MPSTHLEWFAASQIHRMANPLISRGAVACPKYSFSTANTLPDFDAKATNVVPFQMVVKAHHTRVIANVRGHKGTACNTCFVSLDSWI